MITQAAMDLIVDLFTKPFPSIYKSLPTVTIHGEEKVCKRIDGDPVRYTDLKGSLITYDNRNAVYQPAGYRAAACKQVFLSLRDLYSEDSSEFFKVAAYVTASDNKDMRTMFAVFCSLVGNPGLYELSENLTLGNNGNALPRDILRVGEIIKVLSDSGFLNEVNYKFGRNIRYGRYRRTVERYLRRLEQDVDRFARLVGRGERRNIMQLARIVGYKPTSVRFFEILRWKQVQSKTHGKRELLDVNINEAVSLDGMSTKQVIDTMISEQIPFRMVQTRIANANHNVGSILKAAILNDLISKAEIVINMPKIESTGILIDAEVNAKVLAAVTSSNNLRGMNIKNNLTSVDAKAMLDVATESALKDTIDPSMSDIAFYICVDKSGSMQGAIEKAKMITQKLVLSIPLENLTVSTFNVAGYSIPIKERTVAAVERAFERERADGGTLYATGIQNLLAQRPLKPGQRSIFIIIGDEEDNRNNVNLKDHFKDIKPTACIVLNDWSKTDYIRRLFSAFEIPTVKVEGAIFERTYNLPSTIKMVLRSIVPSMNEEFISELMRDINNFEKPARVQCCL